MNMEDLKKLMAAATPGPSQADRQPGLWQTETTVAKQADERMR